MFFEEQYKETLLFSSWLYTFIQCFPLIKIDNVISTSHKLFKSKDTKEVLIKLLDNQYNDFSLWKCIVISEQR